MNEKSLRKSKSIQSDECNRFLFKIKKKTNESVFMNEKVKQNNRYKMIELKTICGILIVIKRSSIKTSANLTVRCRRCVITKTFSCVKHLYIYVMCQCVRDCMRKCTKSSMKPNVQMVDFRLQCGVHLKTNERKKNL